LECILRAPVKEDCAFEGEGSPAVGDGRCVETAAMGTENKDRERAEVARRRIEANSLAVDASVACCAGGAWVFRRGALRFKEGQRRK
jgi:hypothetical protein